MPELQDQTHAAHLWPIAQHGDLAPDLGAFLASVAIHSCTPIKRSHKSKTVGCVCVCTAKWKHCTLEDHAVELSMNVIGCAVMLFCIIFSY